ncbi:ABC transporter substrate-binding protein [Demequina mangrovi]|uniref:Amino acid/amide ABC transporter substrate-binding protein, HAAT family n=1 Tax=Demequina mangrovi TaxID=1043493 RepID=A0A1H6TNU3_9MICO|nr:ABC transporter substrate-binding protein [Demequina mangrovi]SEI79854.1 amino acid/amide ABC transporter substrate-binding protein, HAAT family [Demequina mangrovi]
MARWNSIARGAAFAAVATLSLAACSSDSSDGGSSSDATDGGSAPSGEALKIGSFLPVTGSLAFLGPPEVAGVKVAVNEINEAGGLFEQDVELMETDSGDANNPTIGDQSISELINAGVSAIIGAASSASTLLVLDDVDAAGIVMVSPANTSTSLSGYSEYYFRTAPPDTAQGAAVADLMMGEGASNIAILVQGDDYGVSFRDVVQERVEGAGGTITYGTSGEEVDPAGGNFNANVEAALATNPDAILMIAFDVTSQIVPAIFDAGYDMSKVYMSDGNTSNWGETFAPGTLAGGKGTIPGSAPSDEFKALLDEANGSELEDVSYANESYDAVMLVALAALQGGASDPDTIQANMASVSGADGGTECSGWVECSELILAGETINYQALSLSGPFNEENDPTAAVIGVWEYDDENNISRVDEVEWSAGE